MKATFRRLVQLPAQLFARSASPRPRTFRKPHRLRLESLEDRSLLTATCTSFTSGDLTIDGDGSGETITVGSSSGNVTVNASTLLCAGNPVAATNVDKLTVNGNGGNDTISLALVTAATFTHGSLPGNISINGGDDHDTMVGSPLAEAISGGSGNDIMAGYEGNDTMDGGSGSDTFKYDNTAVNHHTDTINEYNGTGEIDTIDFADAPVAITIDVSNTSSQLVSLGYLSIDLNSNNVIENVLGTEYADSITGNSQANVLTGNDGNDFISGGDGNDTLNGNDGDDTLLDLNDGDDLLIGNDGDDFLYAGPGEDICAGGAGDDTIYGSDGDDAMGGGSGSDTYFYGSVPSHHNTDTITEENNVGDIDTLDFSGLPATLSIDIDISDTSLQTVTFGYVYIELNSGDVIENVIGTAYADSITGNSQNNVLTGNAGDDIIFGGSGNDVMNGNAGDDLLVDDANGGQDTLNGGDDNDTLYGGTGVDSLTGGNGTDTHIQGISEDVFGDSIEVYIP